MNNKNYVVYHLHSELSLLDSCTKFEDYVKKAYELGQTAIASTEHGNIYLWTEKKRLCDKYGIKYIHGCEVYLTEKLYHYRLNRDKNGIEEYKIRDNYHTILIAKNYQGVLELNSIISKSTENNHVYYKPRITFEEFINISDNIIRISACLASPINRIENRVLSLQNEIVELESELSTIRDTEIRLVYQNLIDIKKEDLNNLTHIIPKLLSHYDYYEIQYHNVPEQVNYNKKLYELSLKYNKLLIAGTDTHSINKYKAECRLILQKAKTGAIFGTSKKDKGSDFADIENEFDLTYKSYEDLVEMFRVQNSLPMDVILEAIDNTNKMADSVENFELDASIKYPHMSDNDDETLRDLTYKMLEEKIENGIIPKNEVEDFKNDIEEELRVFSKVNMSGFMLSMSDICRWARNNGHPLGNARGSCGGSRIAYITDIIDLDPVKWNTVFSRFCNEDRVEVGDIDIDIYEDDRPFVYDYIINKFGENNTAYVLALGTIAEKGAMDDIGRALEYPLDEVKKIKLLYEQDEMAAREKYKDLFYYFDGLVGTAVSQSMHPAGIIASPITLSDNYGTFISDGKKIICLDMEAVHEIGLVKYDVLGLRSVGLIKETCKLLGKDYPKSYEINWNDKNVWDSIKLSKIGIFQFESEFAYKTLRDFGTQSIEDMSLVTAMIRPSGASYRDSLVKKNFHHNPSKMIDDLLSDTYGQLVYQEQVISFLQKICGLSGSEADNVRRAIGKFLPGI